MVDDAASERLRLRNRQKQKRHRDRHNAERDALLAEVADLRRSLRRAAKLSARRSKPTSTLVPWTAIAATLAEEASEAEATRVALNTHRERLEKLSRSLASMVSTVARGVPMQAEPWNSIALVAEPCARQLGLDWFTRHLHANTERMLQLSAFPCDGAVKDTVVRDCGNGVADLLGRIQIEYSLSLETAHAALRGRIWDELTGVNSSCAVEPLDMDLVARIEHPSCMTYLRSAISADESNFFVAREVRTRDRVVFAQGNFTQDASQPANLQWRPRMYWYVLDRIGPHRTRLRAMLYNGPKIRAGTLVPWQRDTGLMNLTAAPDAEALDFDTFRRLVRRHVQPIMDVDYTALLLPEASPESMATELLDLA
ncbi:hypothetical protein, variant [Saprolegnia diclina VS20]|uniref:BZIP domain-containing protein n=1 Tax=Saprolegnia diclina (strain VS20) TaxID=1156394 RepID=T0RCA2_SAPDV|nr:hypothetical protein SDRG_12404 [Saprolegnia diclina VS20]XP_008616697.1 hypothetical protein, variant [Saprolegnia diclina VS20]EQC29857.1 hypothetical protein SDRG_12404 [Saprolegnia diclina VS20]EQC29858.1 hypothetical protein, variant [Saprolegnia diclina VS20]|eukprot:XP_008616696.1 hypothetical protein SDRG_12404 [Saprolegnia diclina VS20]